jgi:hypothetical protein
MLPIRKVISFVAAFIMGVSIMAAPNDPQINREFDFWIGKWQVVTPKGKVAGTNAIEREYNGFVLHERYSTGHGYSGESLNIYDSVRHVWHQTWVDSDGLLLVLEGGLKNGQMVLEGQTSNTNTPPTKHRITWTPNTDGTVRQLWESTDTAGKWSIAFDGRYIRQ